MAGGTGRKVTTMLFSTILVYVDHRQAICHNRLGNPLRLFVAFLLTMPPAASSRLSQVKFMRKLIHPNLVGVYEFYEDDPEYLRGA